MTVLRKDQLVEGTTTKGGYLVEDQLDSMQDLFYKHGLARRIVKKVTVEKTDTVNIPVADRSSVTAYLVAEAAEVTASQPSYSLKTLNLKKLRVKIPISQELLDDSQEDMLRELADNMAWAIAKKEDEIIFNNSESGSIVGFIGAASIGTESLSSAFLDGDDISKGVMTIVKAGGNKGNIALVVRPEVMHFLRILKDGDNNYMFNEYTANNPILKTGTVGQIMGVPIYETTVLTLTDASPDTSTVLLFDKDAAVMGIRKELYQEQDKDYDFDIWYLYVTERVGFVVIHPSLVYTFTSVKSSAA